MRHSAWSAAALWIPLVLAGCTMAARQSDDQLVDAGFTKVSANSPDWSAALKSLPPHHFAHRVVNGASMVFWSDPVACKCVYSGTAATYAAYKQNHAAEAAAFDESVGGPSSFSQ
jgi:hypothetical protein